MCIPNMKMWSRNSETMQHFRRSNLSCLCFKAQLLKILSVIYKLVQSDSFATKRFSFPLTSAHPISGVLNRLRVSSGCACCSHRDIYYNNTQLFGSQKSVDALVDDISCLLKVPRRALHVVGAPLGSRIDRFQSEVVPERKAGGELGFSPVGHVQRLHLGRSVLYGERRHEDQLQLHSGCCSLLKH